MSWDTDQCLFFSQRIVAITHENFIAAIVQAEEFQRNTRDPGFEISLGCLPFSHIYGLWTAHLLLYYGDSVIIHRGFNFMEIMASIAKYRINTLYLVGLGQVRPSQAYLEWRN